MNKYKPKLDIERCPSCFEWFPLDKMQEVIIDEFFSGQLYEEVQKDGSKRSNIRYFLDQKCALFCEDCVGRIECK